jgi:hypothetical protein
VRTPRSLLALIQLTALCQIIFGAIILKALTDNSDIPSHIREDWVRAEILKWHESSRLTATRWIVVLGITSFALATATAVLLHPMYRRSRE